MDAVHYRVQIGGLIMYFKNKDTRLNLRLSSNEFAKLYQLSCKRHMSYSQLVRYILNDYFIRFNVQGVDNGNE